MHNITMWSNIIIKHLLAITKGDNLPNEPVILVGYSCVSNSWAILVGYSRRSNLLDKKPPAIKNQLKKLTIFEF